MSMNEREMILVAQRDSAVLALIAVRAYLTGAHNVDKPTTDSEKIELALAAIEKALPNR